MQHDFEYKGAAEMPYNPTDYGLPVWREKGHLPSETVEKDQTKTEACSIIIEQAKYRLLSYVMDQLGYHESEDNWNKYAVMSEMTIFQRHFFVD